MSIQFTNPSVTSQQRQIEVPVRQVQTQPGTQTRSNPRISRDAASMGRSGGSGRSHGRTQGKSLEGRVSRTEETEEEDEVDEKQEDMEVGTELGGDSSSEHGDMTDDEKNKNHFANEDAVIQLQTRQELLEKVLGKAEKTQAKESHSHDIPEGVLVTRESLLEDIRSYGLSNCLLNLETQIQTWGALPSQHIIETANGTLEQRPENDVGIVGYHHAIINIQTTLACKHCILACKEATETSQKRIGELYA